MTKYIMAGLLILCLGLGFGLKVQIQRNGAQAEQLKGLTQALAGAQAARKRDSATLVARERERVSAARKIETQRAQLDDALRANQAWADQQVPKEVQDVLESKASVPVVPGK